MTFTGKIGCQELVKHMHYMSVYKRDDNHVVMAKWTLTHKQQIARAALLYMAVAENFDLTTTSHRVHTPKCDLSDLVVFFLGKN